MPRNASDTRERLVDAGRTLFSRQGVYSTPLKAVVEAAGQRNPSALHYHFGSRAGLLNAILDSHNSDRKSTRLNSSHVALSRMPSSA